MYSYVNTPVLFNACIQDRNVLFPSIIMIILKWLSLPQMCCVYHNAAESSATKYNPRAIILARFDTPMRDERFRYTKSIGIIVGDTLRDCERSWDNRMKWERYFASFPRKFARHKFHSFFYFCTSSKMYRIDYKKVHSK